MIVVAQNKRSVGIVSSSSQRHTKDPLIDLALVLEDGNEGWEVGFALVDSRKAHNAVNGKAGEAGVSLVGCSKLRAGRGGSQGHVVHHNVAINVTAGVGNGVGMVCGLDGGGVVNTKAVSLHAGCTGAIFAVHPHVI